MKVGLGTVQFGLSYGISNQLGQPRLADVREILAAALRGGISTLDTAAQYGTSEQVLGQAFAGLADDGRAFEIVTKGPTFGQERITPADALRLRADFETSLARLRRPSVRGLLLHNVNDLLAPGGDHLLDELRAIRDRGLVRRIGVSVYCADQLDRIADRTGDGAIDLIQLPFSIVDQRLLQSGHLRRLKARGVEIHSRSAFLQGALLMDPAQHPPALAPVRARFDALRARAAAQGLTMLQAALGFCLAQPDLDRVIVGVTSPAELAEIIAAARATTAPAALELGADAAWDDERALNPHRWREAAS